MQKIISHLWFDSQAEAAAEFYTALFANSKTGMISRYNKEAEAVSGKPAGSVMTVEFQLAGREFIALNGGPGVFEFTPAISFFVTCETLGEIDTLWKKLADGGKVLMELGKYPATEKFGWLEDKFGVSWQLNLGTAQQKIATALMFTGKHHAQAEDAMDFYMTLFKNSDAIQVQHYGPDETDPPGTLKFGRFVLAGREFIAMDSARDHKFNFTGAISLYVNCETQTEVDTLWQKLSDGGEIQQCGWLTDKFGVTWQIIPTALPKLLSDPDPAKAGRVMKAMLKMKKIDIKTLEDAAKG